MSAELQRLGYDSNARRGAARCAEGVRSACLVPLEQYLDTLRETDAIARDQIVTVGATVDAHLVGALLEAAHATVAYVARVSTFVERARAGLVDLETLQRAAEAAGDLLP